MVSELPSASENIVNKASVTNNIFPEDSGCISQDLVGTLLRPNQRVLAPGTNTNPLGDITATSWGGSNAAGTETLPISLSPYLSKSDTVLVPRADNAAVINNSTVFADMVLGVARKFWIGRREFFPTLCTNIDLSDDPSPAQQLRTIASTAVEVIGLLAGLGPYIYGVVSLSQTPSTLTTPIHEWNCCTKRVTQLEICRLHGIRHVLAYIQQPGV
jgi:hypothetical protein